MYINPKWLTKLKMASQQLFFFVGGGAGGRAVTHVHIIVAGE